MPKEVVYKTKAPYSKKLDTPLLQKKEYFPTKTEWALSGNRQVIYKQANISGTGVNILYTVPVGYNLFIIYAFLRGHGNGSYNFGADNFDPLLNFTIVDTYQMFANFNNLVKITQGNRVYLGLAGAGGDLSGAFYGYLEKI